MFLKLYYFDAQELRRRRIDQSIELRKAKKEEQLQKRRNVVGDDISPLKETQVDVPDAINYEQIVTDMRSADEKIRFAAVQLCRKTLSRANNPPIDEFFQRGCVKALTNALDSQSYVLDNSDVS